MAKVIFSKREIEEHFKLDEKTLEAINLFGTPAQLSQDSLEVEIFPNRPDLLSLQGFVRAIKAFLGKEPGLKAYRINGSDYKLHVDKSIPDEWPYAVACIIKGLSLDDSKIKEIIQLQEKLGSTLLRNRKKGGLGLYPLEKITFPVEFLGLPGEKIKFRPLEFPDEINGREILAKHPTGREYAHIIQDWGKFPVFMDKKGKILSMPPIINSHDLGKIGHNTKDVFIEATGTDYRTIKAALNILATALSDMGGKIYSIECIQKSGHKEILPNLSPEVMRLNLENANSLLGLEIKEKDVPRLLSKMGYDSSSGKAKIPAWRTDILHEVDIIEDLAIAYGYNNLTPEIPSISTIAEQDFKNKLNNKIAEILIGLGLQEISSFHLIKNEEADKIKQDKIEVLDSKTDYKILRQGLLIPAFRFFSENKDAEYPQRIFELGKVFIKSQSRKIPGIYETFHLLIALSPGNFTEIKQALDYLAKNLSLGFQVKESSKPGLIEGRTGSIFFNEKEIGFIGEAHPGTLRDFNVKLPLAVLEISLEEISDFLLNRIA